MISRCVEDALHLFSYGAPYNIDLRVFAFLSLDEFDHFSIDGLYINKANLCAVKSVCSDALKRNELVQILIKYGLATEQPDGFLSMHELQLEILRDYIYPQNNWSFYIYVALGDFADAGNVNWLHYHQHEAYIARHWEDRARQNIASVSVVELLTLQRQEARVSLLIQEFVARLRDNPIITIAEFNEKEYSIRCAIKDMTDTYVAVEEKVAEPNLIIDFLYRLIETEVFYRSMGLYWPATIAIYFSLHALYLAFMRWGYDSTIDLLRYGNNTNSRKGNLEKLLQEIRKCFPPHYIIK